MLPLQGCIRNNRIFAGKNVFFAVRAVRKKVGDLFSPEHLVMYYLE
jgi:hypothetical protein